MRSGDAECAGKLRADVENEAMVGQREVPFVFAILVTIDSNMGKVRSTDWYQVGEESHIENSRQEMVRSQCSAERRDPMVDTVMHTQIPCNQGCIVPAAWEAISTISDCVFLPKVTSLRAAQPTDEAM